MKLLNADVDTVSLIEGIWSNEKDTFKIGIYKPEGEKRFIAFILDSREPVMKKGDIMAEFFYSEFGYIYATEYYIEDEKKIDTETYVDDRGMLLIFLQKWGKEDIALHRIYPTNKEEEPKEVEQAEAETEAEAEKKEIIPKVNQSLTIETEPENNEYYVQVGSWKTLQYAEEMRTKLKKLYSHVQLIHHNDFYKVRVLGITSKTEGAAISQFIESRFKMKSLLVLKLQQTFLHDAVKPFMGTPYSQIDCYGLIVRGLVNQGVQYHGQGGLREKLENLALHNGLPKNAYLNGEGLVEKAGTIIYSEALHNIRDAQGETDKIYTGVKPYLREGLILSFSTTTRGHTGIVSRWEDNWTYINSGVMDHQVTSADASERVGEEFLLAEIRNWVVFASERKEPLTVTLGKIDQDPLQVFDRSWKTKKLTALDIY